MGVAADPRTGVIRIEKPARQGDPVAPMQYGASLTNGLAGNARPDDGLGWIICAAEQGYVEALMTMGTTSCRGNFGDPDIVVAYKWFWIAANMGEGRAMQIMDGLKEEMTPT